VISLPLFALRNGISHSCKTVPTPPTTTAIGTNVRPHTATATAKPIFLTKVRTHSRGFISGAPGAQNPAPTEGAAAELQRCAGLVNPAWRAGSPL
jgi:hypothetical protein